MEGVVVMRYGELFHGGKGRWQTQGGNLAGGALDRSLLPPQLVKGQKYGTQCRLPVHRSIAGRLLPAAHQANITAAQRLHANSGAPQPCPLPAREGVSRPNAGLPQPSSPPVACVPRPTLSPAVPKRFGSGRTPRLFRRLNPSQPPPGPPASPLTRLPPQARCPCKPTLQPPVPICPTCTPLPPAVRPTCTPPHSHPNPPCTPPSPPTPALSHLHAQAELQLLRLAEHPQRRHPVPAVRAVQQQHQPLAVLAVTLPQHGQLAEGHHAAQRRG